MDTGNYMANQMDDLIEHGVQKRNYLDENLIVGAKIKIGKQYAESKEFSSLNEGDIIELIEGEFDEYNGLYCYNSNAPSIWNEEQNEFDSIFHLFGNDFEYWMDNEIVTQ